MPALSAHCVSFTHYKESLFVTVAEDLNELENEDGNNDEQIADRGEDHLDSYVKKGISTNEYKNKQRRANLLSHVS